MTQDLDGGAVGASASPVQLAQGLVHAAWGGRFLDYAGILADDFVWIGALPTQYLLSREQTLEVYGAGAWTIPSMSFANDDFREVATMGDLHVVCGSTTVMADPSEGMVYSGRPRITAVFREAASGYELVHLHTSHPVPALRGGVWSYAPAGISRETIRFLCVLTAEFGNGASIELRDVEGTTRVLRPFEVVCLVADRQYTNVHMIGSSFRTRQGIGSLASLLPEDMFIELRRGTIANVAFVSSWDDREVVLVDGMSVPLPHRRSAEVLAALAERRAAFERELDKMGPRLTGGAAQERE